MKLSTIIPVFNEEQSLPELHGEIARVAQDNGYEIEMVFVDDGSNDGSWQAIQALAETDSRVRAIRFRRNFGKAAALDAGFQVAKGDFVFTLDADLQDDPREIPRFLEVIAGELDVVSGWKQVRHDPWHKVLPSRMFNWLVGRLTGVKLHDHNCGFKCYRRAVFEEVQVYGELHRFVPVLAAARGFRVGEMVVNHRARKFGHSKYGIRRLVKGFLDLLTVYFLTGFGHRPQHLLGTLGLFAFTIGGAGLTILTVAWGWTRWNENPVDDLHLHERAVFYYSIVAVLLGGQFMSIGFLAELVTAFQATQKPAYSIRDSIDLGATGGQTGETIVPVSSRLESSMATENFDKPPAS